MSRRRGWRHRTMVQRLLGPLLLAPLALACAGATLPRPGAQREAELAEIKRRLIEIQRQAAVNEVELARLREQVARLETRLSATAPSAAPAPPRPAPATSAPPARPASPPPPPIEDRDLDAVELGPVAAPPPAATPPPPAAAEPSSPVSREAQAIYDAAYTLFHQGSYGEAEERFATFLLANPATELSDNAQYWIGAARFARGDYRAALVALRQTVERYPEGNKVPDALFKIGQTLEELSDPVAAKEVYAEVVRRFPDTAAASLAGERLAALP